MACTCMCFSCTRCCGWHDCYASLCILGLVATLWKQNVWGAHPCLCAMHSKLVPGLFTRARWPSTGCTVVTPRGLAQSKTSCFAPSLQQSLQMPCMTVMGDASPTFWPALLPPQAVRACATSWCFERSFPMRRLPPSGPNTTMYIETKPVTVLPQCPLRLLARLVHLHMERARRGFGAPAWQAQARAPELVLNQR